MLKDRGAAVVGLTLFVGLFAFALWAEVSSQNNPAAQGPHDTKNSAQSYIDPRTSEERIADYTLWLERFTGLLAVVSAIQIGFLYRADKTARISAAAAP